MKFHKQVPYREYPTILWSACATNFRYWRCTLLIEALHAAVGQKALDVAASMRACRSPHGKTKSTSSFAAAGSGSASILAPFRAWIADIPRWPALDLKTPHLENAPWCFVVFWVKTPRPKRRCGVFFCHNAVFHAYKKGVRGVFGRGVFQKRHKNQKHHGL